MEDVCFQWVGVGIYTPRYVIQRTYGQNIGNRGVTSGGGQVEEQVCGLRLQWLLFSADGAGMDSMRKPQAISGADGFAALLTL
jgi:hypothetical protein